MRGGLNFSGKELAEAIEKHIAAVAGTAPGFHSGQRKHIEELTDEVRGWIALAEPGLTSSEETTQESPEEPEWSVLLPEIGLDIFTSRHSTAKIAYNELSYLEYTVTHGV